MDRPYCLYTFFELEIRRKIDSLFWKFYHKLWQRPVSIAMIRLKELLNNVGLFGIYTKNESLSRSLLLIQKNGNGIAWLHK